MSPFLHLRLIFVAEREEKLLAVSDGGLLLMRREGMADENRFEVIHSIVWPLLSSDHSHSRVLPKHLITASPAVFEFTDYDDVDHFCFLNERALCFIGRDQHDERTLVVIRSEDQFFKDIRRTDYELMLGLPPKPHYSLPYHRFLSRREPQIRSLVARDGHLYLSIVRPYDETSNTFEVWKLLLPQRNSDSDPVQKHIVFTTKVGIYEAVDMAPSTEHLMVTRNFRFSECRIIDTRTGETLSSQCSFSSFPPPSFREFGKALLCWSRSGHKIQFSVIHGPYSYCNPRKYTVFVPLPAGEEREEELWPPVFTSGGRVIFSSCRTILMGYLPGTSAPLEDIALAQIWNRLPPREQESLIAQRVCNYQHILDRALNVLGK